MRPAAALPPLLCLPEPLLLPLFSVFKKCLNGHDLFCFQLSNLLRELLPGTDLLESEGLIWAWAVMEGA